TQRRLATSEPRSRGPRTESGKHAGARRAGVRRAHRSLARLLRRTTMDRRDAAEFTVYEVNGWRLRRNGTAVMVTNRAPDSRWFGAAPELLAELRGDAAAPLIDRIERAAADYPYANTYRVWPGPNSNTFTAFVLREVPELRVDLPATAIGKDYLGIVPVARTPSGTGGQGRV